VTLWLASSAALRRLKLRPSSGGGAAAGISAYRQWLHLSAGWRLGVGGGGSSAVTALS